MNKQTYQDTKQANREAAAEKSRLAQLKRDNQPVSFPVPPTRASMRARGRYPTAGAGGKRRLALRLLNQQVRDELRVSA